MELTLAHIQAAGAALVQTNQPALAADFYRVAIGAAPDDPTLLTCLAGALRLMREPIESERVIRAAIEIEPSAGRWVALAMAQHDGNRLREAEWTARGALARYPDYPDASGALAVILITRWQRAEGGDECLSEAEGLLDSAIACLPDDQLANYHGARLCLLQFTSRNEEWRLEAERLRLKYRDVYAFEIHAGFARIMAGDLRRGLPAVARWTFRQPDVDRSDIDNRPEWRPGLVGPVTCWNRDGAGDVFQLARYFKRAAEHGAELHVLASMGQDRLLARCAGVAGVVGPADEKKPHLITTWDLASYFTTRESEIPKPPYLSADADTIAKWGSRLAHVPGYRIGVCWRGDPRYKNDRRRSFRASDLAPLFELEGVSLFSLQKCGRDDVLGTPIIWLGGRYEDGDWLDTAGVIANLDLVISADTGIAHLAGGMAHPVWMAIPEPGDFRWMAGRDDSPWYPTMRIFRQTRRGVWSDVFERMAEQLYRAIA